MVKNVPLFLKRYALSYFREGFCVEYFIKKRLSLETISSSLVFSYNCRSKDLHISRFYPDLNLQPRSKYMSAVCFYLLVHHCANCFSLNETCHVCLETVPDVCSNFYAKLKDFNFHIKKSGLGNVVELVSDLCPAGIDTRMIEEHIFGEGEMPFMK